MSALELVYVVIITRIGLPFIYGAAACATVEYFLWQCVWRIAPIRFNNVSLYQLIVISNISGLLRRSRVLNPGRRLNSWMR